MLHPYLGKLTGVVAIFTLSDVPPKFLSLLTFLFQPILRSKDQIYCHNLFTFVDFCLGEPKSHTVHTIPGFRHLGDQWHNAVLNITYSSIRPAWCRLV